MILDVVAGVPAHLFEEQCEIAALELDSGPAIAADQVVMMSMAYGCIPVTTVFGVDAPHKTEVREQVQGPIHGYQAYGRTVLSGPGVNLSRTGMDPVFQERLDHSPAGLGHAIPGLIQLLQDLFFYKHACK